MSRYPLEATATGMATGTGATGAARPVARAPRLVLLTRDDPARVTGGVETFARHLRQVFTELGVLAYAGAAGRRLLFNEARDARAVTPALDRLTREAHATVIVANGAGAWAADAGVPAHRPPLVTVYHGTYAGFARALGRHAPMHALWTRTVGAALERRAGRNADRVVAVSPRVAREAFRAYGVRAQVIPNAVDPPVEAPANARAARSRLGLDPSRPAILFVGRPTWAKGFDRVRLLARKRPGLTVLAAGPEPAPSLPANLIALGSLEASRLSRLYAAADAIVLPSRYEGCSYVPLEAMAAGRPVVVTAVGAFEQVGRQPFGIVVPCGDARRFVAAVDELLGSKETFEPRAWVAEHHGIERFRASWRRLVTEVADGR